METKEVTRSRLMLLSSMLIYGTVGIFRHFLPVPSGVLAFLRGVIGAAVLCAVLLIRRQKTDCRAFRKAWLPLCISGAMIGFNWILLFEAYRYTTVAVATLCYYMQPVFVMLLSPLVLKERLTVRKSICVVVSLLGIVLITVVGKADGVSGWKGILLGLGAAALYAGVVLINKKMPPLSAYEKTVCQLSAAAVVVLPYTLMTGEWSEVTVTPVSVILLLTIGILHTGIAYALFFGSMERLPAQTVALYSYVDPVTAVVLSALLLKEPLGWTGAVGAVLILGATLIGEWQKIQR